MISGGS